jgi:hypothetical protein
VSRGNRLTAKGQTHKLCGCKGGQVSSRSGPTAKGQTHTLCRRKRRTSEQREQADGKGADSQPMQAQKGDQ